MKDSSSCVASLLSVSTITNNIIADGEDEIDTEVEEPPLKKLKGKCYIQLDIVIYCRRCYQYLKLFVPFSVRGLY